MSRKLKVAVIWIIGLLAGGSLLIYLGLAKGTDIASAMSRPWGASSWTIPNELIKAWTYGPIVLGTTLIVMGVIAFSVVFTDWYKRERNKTEKEEN